MADAYAQLRYFRNPHPVWALPDSEQSQVQNWIGDLYTGQCQMLADWIEQGNKVVIIAEYPTYISRLKSIKECSKKKDFKLHNNQYVICGLDGYRFRGLDKYKVKVVTIGDSKSIMWLTEYAKSLGYNVLDGNL